MNSRDIWVNALRKHEQAHYEHQLAVKDYHDDKEEHNGLRILMIQKGAQASYTGGVLEGIIDGLLMAVLASRDEEE